MASVDRTSVTAEIARLETEFKGLCGKGVVSPEIKVLFGGVLALVRLLMAVLLERSTKKTSKNSGIPPSQSDHDESARRVPRSKDDSAAVPREPPAVRVVETVESSPVFECEECGESLDRVRVLSVERRTKVDVVFERVVTHVDADVKECPACHARTTGEFPPEYKAPLHYGSGLKAYLVSLSCCDMVSLSRIAQLVRSTFGVSISESTILDAVKRLHASLETWEDAAKKALISAGVVNADETSMRVAKKNSWVHVYSSGDLTLKLLHAKRGTEAMEDFGVLPVFRGLLVHDCWSSYLSWDGCRHGLCGSHLLRELAFVYESGHYRWAKNIKRLLRDTCRKVSSRKRRRLTPREYERLTKRYRRILKRGEEELPTVPPRRQGQRGRLPKTDARNLHGRLACYEEAVLAFAKHSEVPFTNNRAEQDLRMGKVKQKVSGCFRTEHFARAYCRISSYLSTIKRKGYSPISAVQMALRGDAPVADLV